MSKYKKISEEKYREFFDINTKKASKINRAALERAWKNRDFEINKFWHRAAYFWGFIVLIFGGYISIRTKADPENEMLEFLLICVGLIFSIAWTFVIIGSKQWQENWEGHIDRLEDKITGPLYKIIVNDKQKPFYSVSKINEILSYLVIIMWLSLLIENLILSTQLTSVRICVLWWKLLGIIIVVIFFVIIVYGYGRSNKPNTDVLSKRS